MYEKANSAIPNNGDSLKNSNGNNLILIREAYSSRKLANLTAQNVDAMTKNMSGGSSRMYCDSVRVPVSVNRWQGAT